MKLSSLKLVLFASFITLITQGCEGCEISAREPGPTLDKLETIRCTWHNFEGTVNWLSCGFRAGFVNRTGTP